MGCGGVKESNNDPNLSKEEEKEEEESKKKEKKTYNFDKHTINYFNHFTEEEIDLILEKKESVNKKESFSFLYSKFDVNYLDKKLSKNNIIECKEYLVSYVNPNYVGNFGYESQIIGFCPEKVSLEYCRIKNEKVYAKMKNNGKIISVLIIEETHKDEEIKDIMVFEFVYNIAQLKMYGMRIIDIIYEEPMSCSILIKYDKKEFIIKSNDNSEDNSKNKFYLFNKDKICLVLNDINNNISIESAGSKISKLLYDTFSEDEIKKINSSLQKMDIKPYEKNIIYEKMTHNLKNNKDYVKGNILIFYPSFEKNYFYLCEGINKTPDHVDFLVNELKVNSELLINMKKVDGKNHRKPENYYESTNTSHRYIISTKDDFILFEFELEGIDSQEDEDEIHYNLDARNIFNFYLNNGSSYKFEIVLNKHEVFFIDDDTYKYKYKKTKENITFEGVWTLKEWDNKKSKKYLPNELVIKK